MDAEPAPVQSQSPLYPPRVVRLRLPLSKPLWTYVILAANLLVFALAQLIGPNLVLALGAKDNQAIISGEVWRLVTSMFLHIGLLHIAFNSYALWIFGPRVERAYGRAHFFLMYGLSGLGGSALSFFMSPHPSVGASGAIFGLIGVLGAYFYRYRERLTAGRAQLTNIVSIAVYNLLYGFIVPAVDNWAHIGGLLVGLTLGWFLAPRYEVVHPTAWEAPQVIDRRSPRHLLLGVALAVGGICLALLGGFARW